MFLMGLPNLTALPSPTDLTRLIELPVKMGRSLRTDRQLRLLVRKTLKSANTYLFGDQGLVSVGTCGAFLDIDCIRW